MSQFDPPPVYKPNPNETGYPPNAAVSQSTTNSKEQLLRVVAVALRAFSLLFSFLSFVIILTVKDFNKVDTFNYVLAASLFSIIYNAFQTVKGVFQIAAKRELIRNAKGSAFVDFIGDHLITYLVLSASSAGIAVSNETMQLYKDWDLETKEVSKAAGATSMLFFAFVTLTFPTIISFQKLFNALN